METIARASQVSPRHAQRSKPASRLHGFQRPDLPSSPVASGLSVRVLRTEIERYAIAGLRKLAAFGVEKDLELELAPLEKARDEIGIVTAVYQNQRVIATTRFVPTGYGMTAAERLQKTHSVRTQSFGCHSWEVGRIIMAPEDRDPALLPRCLGLALTSLQKLEDPRHLHASTTLPMARLWRRFGMQTAAVMHGGSGQRYALVEGDVKVVAAILQVPDIYRQGLHTS